MPRWGLIDPATLGPPAPVAAPTRGPSPWAVRATLVVTVAALGAAALLHLVRYILLIVNRSTLLPVFVAGAATWLGVLASVAAMFAVAGCAIVLTEWLIARRAAAFGCRHQEEPRPLWELRLGCLIPLLNLAWAPVYVIELAVVEERYARMRKEIWVWWVLFLLSTVVSIFATATSFTQEAQGIADNTVSFVVAYLLATAAMVMAARLVWAFERAPVERPAHRWVIVPTDSSPDHPVPGAGRESGRNTAPTVEEEDREPAA